MNAIDKIDFQLGRLYRICGYLAASLIVLMVFLVLGNIISRLTNSFIPGLTEIAGYCLAGSGALGLAYTFGDDGHIRVTMLLDHLEGKYRSVLEIWALGISTGLISFVAVYMVKLLYFSWVYKDRSDGSDAMLLWIVQIPMVLGFIVFAVCLVHALVKILFGKDIADKPHSKESY